MEKQAHPIALEQVFFTRTVVVAIPDHKPNGETLVISPENSIDLVAIEGEQGRFMATMHTILNQGSDPSAPYSIDMECIGMFIADKSLPLEEATRGVMITAHSVLFGAIREAVSWITGRHPYGQLMLGLSVLKSKSPANTD